MAGGHPPKDFWPYLECLSGHFFEFCKRLNEVYFDDMVPAFGYRLLVSFIDLKSNLYYSDVAEVQVYPGTTTVVVLSMYVPTEKERLQSQGTPRINIFQFFGKGLELLPKG